MPDAFGRSSITLDELIALNDEIAGLTRAGLPIEAGLMAMGSDYPGRLGAITTAISEEMKSGKTLPEALERAKVKIPSVYKAVVNAGIRSGKLSVALESLTSYAKAAIEARRSVALALWYPLLLMLLSYTLFVLLVTILVPRFVIAFDDLGLPIHFGVRLLEKLGETSLYWGPLLPVVVILILIALSIANRASVLGASGRSSPLLWIPSIGSMMRRFEAAGFADLLALLVEHGVPMNEAISLAGLASGDPRIDRASQSAAHALRLGLPLSEIPELKKAFPPLLRWMIASGQSHQELVGGLRKMAERYRNLARYQSEKLRVVLPMFLMLTIGATSAFLYGLALFVPLTSLWNALALQAP